MTRMSTAERHVSKGMRFFLAPQMSSGLYGARALVASFVQTLASILANAGLLDPTHKSLHPTSMEDIKTGEILSAAWQRVKAPGRRADQVAVFAAIAILPVLGVLSALTLAGSTMIGAAHALTPIATAPTACSPAAAGSSLFTAPCSTDIGQQWINMLLMGDTTSWFASQVVSLPVAAGLAALFTTYSSAMLIIAGFLVLYHLLSIVAETASAGKVGGRSFNQVWAPLRLVFAMGMLVPLGGTTGLNGGQYMVTQVGKWGSAMASNAWLNFANSYGDSMGAYVILPPLPNITNMMQDLVVLEVCQQSMQHFAEKIAAVDAGTMPYNPSTTSWHKIEKNIIKKWIIRYTAGSSTTTLEAEVCGNVTLPDPAVSITGASYTLLDAGTSVDASNTLRRGIVAAHRDAIDAIAASHIRPLARDIVLATQPGALEAERMTYEKWKKFTEGISAYRVRINDAVRTILATSSFSTKDFSADAGARGWVSASVWFNDIARMNGMLIDSAKITPVVAVRADYGRHLSEDAVAIINGTIGYTTNELGNLPSLFAAGGDTWPEDGGSKEGGFSSKDALDGFFGYLTENVSKLLGSGANSSDLGGTVGTFARGFQLNTGNPLAELSALGHRIISLAVTASKTASNCGRGGAFERHAARLSDSDSDTRERFQAARDNVCGSNPTSIFLISMLTGAMITAGITLAFLLPLMPFIRFMFGILTWILGLLEAVVAIPLVALAHIRTDGEGLSGPMARTAYLLVLQIFARPILMIFGLIVALLVFNLMIVILNTLFMQAARAAEGGGDMQGWSLAVYTMIYAFLAYAFANASFKAIDLIPNQALQWIGGHNVTGIDESHRVSAGIAQTGGAIGMASNQISNQGRMAALGNTPASQPAGGGAAPAGPGLRTDPNNFGPGGFTGGPRKI